MRQISRLLFLFSFFPLGALATPIQFIHTGVGSGTIGSTAFQDASFRITGVGDTANLRYGGGRWIYHTSASIWIDGIGTTAITSGTRTWVNGNYMGFGRATDPTTGGYDLYNWSNYSQFSGWDMLTSFSQISGTARLFQWSGTGYPDVTTSLGTLVFDFDNAVPATFEAIVGDIVPEPVPEPAPLLLTALGLIGMRMARRKNAG